MAPYRMTDDSVTVKGKGNPEYAGKSITRRGEDQRKNEVEPGRYDSGEAGHERESGKSTARDTTGIFPQDPIDTKSPNLRG